MKIMKPMVVVELEDGRAFEVKEMHYSIAANRAGQKGHLCLKKFGLNVPVEGLNATVLWGYEGSEPERLAVRLLPDKGNCCFEIRDVLNLEGQAVAEDAVYSGSLRGAMEGVFGDMDSEIFPDLSLTDWRPEARSLGAFLEEGRQLFGGGFVVDKAGELRRLATENTERSLGLEELYGVESLGKSSPYAGLEVVVAEGAGLKKSFRGTHDGAQCRLFRPEVVADDLEVLTDSLAENALSKAVYGLEVPGWLAVSVGDRLRLPETIMGSELMVMEVEYAWGSAGMAGRIMSYELLPSEA